MAKAFYSGTPLQEGLRGEPGLVRFGWTSKTLSPNRKLRNHPIPKDTWLLSGVLPSGGLLVALWWPSGGLLVAFWWPPGGLLVGCWCEAVLESPRTKKDFTNLISR